MSAIAVDHYGGIILSVLAALTIIIFVRLTLILLLLLPKCYLWLDFSLLQLAPT